MAEMRKKPMRPMHGRGAPVPKGVIKKGTFGRLIKTLFKYYKWQTFVVLVCLLLNAFGSLISSVFMKTLIDSVITPGLKVGLGEVWGDLIALVTIMACAYGMVVLTGFFWNRIMAGITQGMLYHLRKEMFEKMQTLPIKYFDTHAHGEIMST